jgi:hypothetical protein
MLLALQPEMTIKSAVNYKSFPVNVLKEIILLVNSKSQMHVYLRPSTIFNISDNISRPQLRNFREIQYE